MSDHVNRAIMRKKGIWKNDDWKNQRRADGKNVASFWHSIHIKI